MPANKMSKRWTACWALFLARSGDLFQKDGTGHRMGH